MNTQFIGIDGCPFGWCVASYSGEITIELYSTIDEVIQNFNTAELILIDIPIGLTSKGFERTIDKDIRKLLQPYKQFSVFTPPCREALFSNNYKDSKTINEEVTGKKISKQSYNISDKILEVDIALRNNKHLKKILKESHPELCFKYLNNGNLIKSSKKDKQGQIDRLSILKKYVPDVNQSLQNTLNSTKRKDVKIDDIIDAICLMVCAMVSNNNVEFIGEEIDQEGIPVSMAVPKKFT